MTPTTPPALTPDAAPVLARALERAVGAAFKLANRAGQEARQDLFGLSMSGLGGCTREAAYRLAGTEPTDPALAIDDEARQAMIGTWVHAGLLPHLERVLHGADTEMKVELRVPVEDPTTTHPHQRAVSVRGSADCYTPTLGGGVLDLKTVNAYKLGDIDHDGVYATHRTQVRGYAAAIRQLGLPVTWIAWLYMDRSTGEVLVAIEPFGDDEYEQTLAHVRHLWNLADNPDYAPRTERGPGLSWKCDVCPWLKQCWGPDAEPGDSRALATHDAADIALAARRYKELGDQIKKLTAEQDRYGAMVGRPEPGRYGETTVTFGKDGEKLDPAEALYLLELHGIAPPMKPRRGARYIRWATNRTAKET